MGIQFEANFGQAALGCSSGVEPAEAPAVAVCTLTSTAGVVWEFDLRCDLVA